MEKALKILFMILILPVGLYAATHNVSTSDKNYAQGVDFTAAAGDTIFFPAGTYNIGQYYFSDFIGTKANPIVIDLNGQTVDANGEHSAIRLRDCDYITLTNGTCTNSANNVVLAELTPNVIFDNLTVTNGSSSGIRAGIQTTEGTTQYYRSAYTEDYVIVRNCTVHDMTYEGIYIGNSNNENPQFASDGTVFYKSFIDSVIVENCTVYNTGYDAIQVGAAEGFAWIHDNEAYAFAGANVGNHSSGIQLGEATEALCYNNYIHDATFEIGAGIAGLGQGMIMFNNRISDVNAGIFIYDRYTAPNKTNRIYNNTITNIASWGIDNRTVNTFHNKIWNNILHTQTVPDTASVYWYYTENGASADLQGNVYEYGSGGLTNLNFTDEPNGDYTLQAGSTAEDAGVLILGDISELIINAAGDLRPLTGTTWDAGAY